MPIFVYRVLSSLIQVRTWAPPTLLIALVFATSWPLMWLVEPAGADIVQPANYWWWFVVTAATVGYGDFYPTTPLGHLVGFFVIVGGIASLTTLFARLVAALEAAKGRHLKGAVTVQASDHIVVLGYTAGRTERIVDELLAERAASSVVLCSWEEVATHPMPERGIGFVRGELTDAAVLERAGVPRAEAVLVDARDDNEALALAVTVDHVAPGVRVVVALRDLARATQFGYVGQSVYCVQWHTPRMITEELQSPGISLVYADLMTHGGGNTYSLRLPDELGPVAYGDCQLALGSRHDATVLAAHTGGTLLVSPPWSTQLSPGAVLYYVSQAPIGPAELVTAVRKAGVVKQRTSS